LVFSNPKECEDSEKTNSLEEKEGRKSHGPYPRKIVFSPFFFSPSGGG